MIFAILLPPALAVAASLYCARELERRRKRAEAMGADVEKCPLAASPAQLEAAASRAETKEPEEAFPTRIGGNARQDQILTGCIALLGIGLYLVSLFYYHDTVEYALKLLFCFDALAAAGVIDAHCRVIPNSLVLALLGGSLGFLVAEWCMGFSLSALLRDAGLGCLLGGGVFLLCALLTRGGIGMGDVKLFGALGTLLGWTGVFDLIFLSVLFVAGYGIVLLLRGKLDRGSQVPIGPFALAGMAALLLLGQ